MKYLYFEVYWQEGEQPSELKIQNENVLLFKPYTNSSGYWGFRNITQGKYYTAYVDQNWIDLDKYKPQPNDWNDPVFKNYDKWVQICIEKLKLKNK